MHACVHAYVYVPVYIEPQGGCPVFFLSRLFLETGSLTVTEFHGFWYSGYPTCFRNSPASCKAGLSCSAMLSSLCGFQSYELGSSWLYSRYFTDRAISPAQEFNICMGFWCKIELYCRFRDNLIWSSVRQVFIIRSMGRLWKTVNHRTYMERGVCVIFWTEDSSIFKKCSFISKR